MLLSLPLDIILEILSNFQIHELHSIQLASRVFNEIVRANESQLYHTLAIQYNFVEPSSLLDDVSGQFPGPLLDSLRNWKDLFRRMYRLELNWQGRGDVPHECYFLDTGFDVHRFKVDEINRLIITTHRKGGLRVSCMDSYALLWALSRNRVRAWAHCEYGNGFLIFDRDSGLEVWKLESMDWDESARSSEFLPDAFQRGATFSGSRGSFVPWALLRTPKPLRAYRFVFPTLLVGAASGEELYLFDIPSATLQQTIPLPKQGDIGLTFGDENDDGSQNVKIQYVELGESYCFVCTNRSVLIVPRNDSRRTVEFPDRDSSMRNVADIQELYTPSHKHLIDCMLVAAKVEEKEESPATIDQRRFNGVHVSETGRDFAAIMKSGLIFLVYDFERVLRGELAFSDVTVCINAGCKVENLAFDFGRVAVHSHRCIYIINADARHHRLERERDMNSSTVSCSPYIPTVYRLRDYGGNGNEMRNGILVSCLKLTRTSIWFDFSPCECGKLPLDLDYAYPINANPYSSVSKRLVFRIDYSPQL